MTGVVAVPFRVLKAVLVSVRVFSLKRSTAGTFGARERIWQEIKQTAVTNITVRFRMVYLT